MSAVGKTVRAGAVQFEHRAADKQANLEKIRSFARLAAARGVRILAFPECCICGYWFLRNLSRSQLFELAEPVPEGPSLQALKALARQHQMTIGAGLIEVEGDRLYNTYLVATAAGECYRHRKIHSFESDHISSGSEYTVFDDPSGWRVGVLTCYDVNICENVRITTLRGAELLLAPHQTGGCRSNDPNIMGLIERSVWEKRHENPAAIEAELRGDKGRGWLMRWLPARAHDNGLFLVFSNGIGVDDDEIRTGNAMIIDPYGRILAETWRAGDDMVIADLDGNLLAEATGRRWIRTRRPQLYGPIAVATGLEQDTRAVRFDDKGA
ncbi:MAG TPA: nitrilase family protein [Acidobacteriota bacterium]|jgi:predicted amidohydrolase